MKANKVQTDRILNMTVIVSALGYFVDIYDLLLFSIVRAQSLKDLGIADADLLAAGVRLISWQMSGLLVGGLLWGILGDKRGRLSVLFGSILLYSIANIANAFVQSVEAYEILRFIAGIGLAGELGAAITLVGETMTKEKRGYGTALVASVGLLGAVFANLLAGFVTWRTAYIVGGVMGLALLFLRVSIFESGLFEMTKASNVERGNFWLLFKSWNRFQRYITCILIGVPIWYVIGVLITFSPEISKELGVDGAISAGKAVMFSYMGISLGDLGSGLLSQWLKSRKKSVAVFMAICTVTVSACLLLRGLTVDQFYFITGLLGFSVGYWAVFITIGAENFGTNLRSTVTSTVPNFVRGAVVPLTMLFKYLGTSMGLINSAAVVGVLSLVIAVVALLGMEESYGRDMDFNEK